MRRIIKVGIGALLAFSGAELIAAAVPVTIGAGGGGNAAWWIAAAVVGYFGVGVGLRGVMYQNHDTGQIGHLAGWATAALAIPFVVLASRNRRHRIATARATTSVE